MDLEERRDALAEALVSGEYVQTMGVLHRANGYCCLGVACEVFRRITGIGEWILDADSGNTFFRVDALEQNAIEMPTAVRGFYGALSGSGDTLPRASRLRTRSTRSGAPRGSAA